MERVFHRQMYIDLVRAYAAEYGNRGAQARALGVSNPAVTYWLEPAGRVAGGHWSDLLADGVSPGYLRGLRTPTEEHARALARHLSTEAERRDALLYHLYRAREPDPVARDGAAQIDLEGIERELQALATIHAEALNSADPIRTRAGYAAVWAAGGSLLRATDGTRYPLQRVRTLMLLNDTASVMNRADRALAFAREALVILAAMPESRDREARARLQLNALFAEVVTLNNLGLAGDAADMAAHALTLAAAALEPETWRRSLLEQRLKALGRRGGGVISEAEYVADWAWSYVEGTPALSLGIDAHLAGAYLGHGTNLSLRKGLRLVDQMRERLTTVDDLVPLRRVRCLRVAAATYSRAGDAKSRDEMLGQALAVTTEAGLVHQEAELVRLYSHATTR